MATKKKKQKKRGRGRPTKLTELVQRKIVLAIQGGNYREVAAQWAGIDPATLSKWMNDKRSEFMEFRKVVLEAEQAAEIQAVSLIVNAAKLDPNHAKWWLERKFPERWANSQKVQVHVERELEGVISQLAGKLDHETYRRVLEALAGDGGGAAPAGEGPQR